MSKVLEGGIVVQERNPSKKAIVEIIYFYTEKKYSEIPRNPIGMLFLQNKCEFEEGDTLSYLDGKTQYILKIDTVIGDTRYEITKLR